MSFNKNRGASLVYVLIVLSVITVFSLNFIHFVRERNSIVFIKKNKENRISKKYLQEMEIKNSEEIFKRGISVRGFLLNLNRKEDYFHSGIHTDTNGKLHLVPLIYLDRNKKSIGNFHIKEIKDSSGNLINVPLAENTVYKNLEILFEKEILEEKLYFKEKVSIDRIDAVTVILNLESSQFSE